MKVETAIDLVNQIVYRPGWKFTATDHTSRFEGSICVRIDYPAQDTGRENAPDYEKQIETYARFPLVVRDLDDIGLWHAICDKITEIDAHEMREYFRVSPTMWAPFHPHNIDGMQRWACKPDTIDLRSDLQFGIS